MAEGARFEVHLTKARGILGDDAKPFEVNLVTEGNALHWQVRELEDVELKSLRRLLKESYSILDCAKVYRLNGKSVPLFCRIRDGAAIDTRKFHQWISSRKRPYAASRDITAGTGGATATPILTTTEV